MFSYESLSSGTSAAQSFTIGRDAEFLISPQDDKGNPGLPTFTFTGGTYTCNGTTSVVAGTLDLSGAQITNLGRLLSLKPIVTDNGFTVGAKIDLGTATTAVHDLYVQSSRLSGTGTLTVTGSAKLYDSVRLDGAGTTIFKGTTNVSSFDDPSSQDLTIAGHTVVNEGVFSLSGSMSVVGGLLQSTAGSAFSAFGEISGSIQLDGSSELKSVTLTGGTLVNTGNLHGIHVEDSGRIINRLGGVYRVDTNGVVLQAGDDGVDGLFDNKGTFLADGSGTSRVELAIVNSHSIVADSGTLVLDGAVTGTGKIAIRDSATVEIGSSITAAQLIAFRGPDAGLVIDHPTDFHAVIGGLAAGDTIDLAGITATRAVVHDDRLIVIAGNSVADVLKLNRNYDNLGFTVAADGHGGTILTVASDSQSAGLVSSDLAVPTQAGLIPTPAASLAQPSA